MTYQVISRCRDVFDVAYEDGGCKNYEDFIAWFRTNTKFPALADVMLSRIKPDYANKALQALNKND